MVEFLPDPTRGSRQAARGDGQEPQLGAHGGLPIALRGGWSSGMRQAAAAWSNWASAGVRAVQKETQGIRRESRCCCCNREALSMATGRRAEGKRVTFLRAGRFPAAQDACDQQDEEKRWERDHACSEHIPSWLSTPRKADRKAGGSAEGEGVADRGFNQHPTAGRGPMATDATCLSPTSSSIVVDLSFPTG